METLTVHYFLYNLIFSNQFVTLVKDLAISPSEFSTVEIMLMSNIAYDESVPESGHLNGARLW